MSAIELICAGWQMMTCQLSTQTDPISIGLFSVSVCANTYVFSRRTLLNSIEH